MLPAKVFNNLIGWRKDTISRNLHLTRKESIPTLRVRMGGWTDVRTEAKTLLRVLRQEIARHVGRRQRRRRHRNGPKGPHWDTQENSSRILSLTCWFSPRMRLNLDEVVSTFELSTRGPNADPIKGLFLFSIPYGFDTKMVSVASMLAPQARPLSCRLLSSVMATNLIFLFAGIIGGRGRWGHADDDDNECQDRNPSVSRYKMHILVLFFRRSPRKSINFSISVMRTATDGRPWRGVV